MKNIFFLLVAGSLAFFSGCKQKDTSKVLDSYVVADKTSPMGQNDTLTLGEGMEEGSEVYGIVAMIDNEGVLQAAKAVKAEIISIEPGKVKMKALEDVSLAPQAGCTKIGIAKGETWIEEEGDLYRTKEEAINSIKAKLNLAKTESGKTKGKYKVD